VVAANDAWNAKRHGLSHALETFAIFVAGTNH